MLTLGLTGGSGSGKGYVSLFLSEMGIKTLDTDFVSREVCKTGTVCLSELRRHFGDGIIKKDENGAEILDRAALAAVAFKKGNEDELHALNVITHRHILNYCRDWLETRKSSGDEIAVIDAPQLYESGFDRECDFVIAVIADRETRIKRIIDRDKITREKAENRIAAQYPDDFYIRNADFIIRNDVFSDVSDDANNPENGVRKQLTDILDKIKKGNFNRE